MEKDLSGEDSPLVIDIGSYHIKAGFGGDHTPKLISPTLIGYPKHPGIMIGMDQKDFYTGHDAKAKKHFLNLSEPVVNGEVTNFDELSKILLDLVVHDLKWTFEKQNVLITENPHTNTKEIREKFAALMFEKFDVSSLFFANQ
jgi:actin-related protein